MKSNGCDLFNIKMEELELLLDPWSLAILLKEEPLTSKIDILLDNMLDYYVSEEKYEYAVVVRDEINDRKLHKKSDLK